MARTGLSNFVVWAIATMFLGWALARGMTGLVVLAAGGVAVAWWTRFWPEGLGVAAGVAALLAFTWLQSLLLYDAVPDRGAGEIVVAAIVAAVTAVVWRLRLDAYIAHHAGDAPADSALPPAPNGHSSPARLLLATVLGSFTLLVVGFFLTMGFGFSCQSDTTHATPGSPHAAHCDLFDGSGHLFFLVIALPPAVVFLIGLFATGRRQPRWVGLAMVIGFALMIAIHVPDWVLSNSA
jgi:hypothetical protein